jgi:CxxC motif-containing protein (DUF1111 family)
MTSAFSQPFNKKVRAETVRSAPGWPIRIVLCVAFVIACGQVFAQSEAVGILSADISGFGQPLPEVVANPGDRAIFQAGQRLFGTPLSIPVLGPLFNNRTCVACHFQPTMGGSGEFISEIHTRSDTTGLPVHTFAVDNMLRAGPQSQAGAAIFTHGLAAVPLGCEISNPNCGLSPCQQAEARLKNFRPDLPICDPTSASFIAGKNCSAQRQSTNLFGLGLVEALDDQTLYALAANQPPAIRGTPRLLDEFGRQRVARFGWKDDGATLRGFADLATANELGLTTPDSPQENTTCADGVIQFGVLLDNGDEPEDQPDAGGRAMVDRLVDFMRGLEPPPQLKPDPSARRGQRLFTQIGCAGCHIPTLTTAADPSQFIPPTTGGVPISVTLNHALAHQTFHPFSDFLLHDMGSLGDGITSGAAGPAMMRTAPLWGVRSKVRLLHDGRTDSLSGAITLHDGQGRDSAGQFKALSPDDQNALISYLNSL